MQLQLEKGAASIPFSMIDLNGQVIDLRSFAGSPVLLSFFRDTTCLFCNLRIHQMIKWLDGNPYPDLKVIAFFTSSADEIKKYTGSQSPPFPIIPDPAYKIYNEYGIGTSIWGKLKALLRFRKMYQALSVGVFSIRSLPKRNTLPADFLIGPDQKIHSAYYGKDLGDHISFLTIEEWLNS
jgi:peroxiredoxin